MRKRLNNSIFCILPFIILFCASVVLADDYYVYGEYTPGHEVYAIDSYDSLLYVADGNGNAYIYSVTIPAGSNPNQHPDNPFAPGPMAPRTFTYISGPYNFAADCGWYGYHHAEFYIDEDYIYYGPDDYGVGGIEKWDKNPDGTFGAYLGREPIPVPPDNGETFGYDAGNNTWYTCTRERTVYSFEVGVSTVWDPLFTYPNYGGDHHDGLEFVGNYLWLSDMTSDFLGQWEYTGTGPYNGWEEINTFTYSNPEDVEGMGFGTFDHLWITSGWSPGIIYEVGGGCIQFYFFDVPDQCILAGEDFESFDLDTLIQGCYPPFTFTCSGYESLTVVIDDDNICTITYRAGWWGEETVTFTVTDSIGGTTSDDATYTVSPVPVVLDIPDQTEPWDPFDLDDYLDPMCGVDPGAVTWTASGQAYFVVDIDPTTHIATVSNPTGWDQPETITFTATAPTCPGDSASDSDDATFYPVRTVAIDIKPQSCPNPLNVGPYTADGGGNVPRGKLPAAILGTEDFDVATIDPSTVTLEGVSPLRWAFEDVAAPVVDPQDPCDCTEDGADGYLDLTLKFSRAEVIAALGSPPNGELPLTMAGMLYDGAAIQGVDCVVIINSPFGAIGLGRESLGIPTTCLLKQNIPNPFNASTTITYGLPEAGQVSLKVYNLTGQEVATLVDGKQEAGYSSVTWNAGDKPSGIYFYRIQAGDFTESVRMILVK